MSIFDDLKKPAAAPQTADKPAEGRFTFVFGSLPESVEQMKALPEAALDTPYKTAALTICALCAYAAREQTGIEMLNFLKGPQPLSPYELSFLRDRFRDGRHIPFSYFEGATPDNSYTPDKPFTVTVFSNPYSFQNEGWATLHINSGGADSPRQIKLRFKPSEGRWCLSEQMVMVGIRAPKSADPWA